MQWVLYGWGGLDAVGRRNGGMTEAEEVGGEGAHLVTCFPGARLSGRIWAYRRRTGCRRPKGFSAYKSSGQGEHRRLLTPFK